MKTNGGQEAEAIYKRVCKLYGTNYEKATKEKEDMKNRMEIKQRVELICKVYVRRENLLGMSLDPYAEVRKKMKAEKHVEAFGGVEKVLSSVIEYCGMTYEEAEQQRKMATHEKRGGN